MIDRELLELAAKAAGIDFKGWPHTSVPGTNRPWNPLTDDGDALRLAVRLGLSLRTTREFEPDVSCAISNKHELDALYLHGANSYAATRRAIVRAAAEIGKTL